MTLSMLAFVLNDGLMKAVFDSMSIYQAIFLRGLITVPLIALLAWQKGALIVRIAPRNRLLVTLRVAAEVDRVLCDEGGSFIIVSHISPHESQQDEGEEGCGADASCDGLAWLSEAILPAFDWQRHGWSVDVHSMRADVKMPHVYVLTRRPRRFTRSAACRSMAGVSITLHEH